MCSALGITDKKPDDIIMKIENFIKAEDKNQNQILRISFEKLSYDFSIREIIVDFISSYLLKKSRGGSFRNTPLVLFIDEARQFLNKRINAEDNTTFSLQIALLILWHLILFKSIIILPFSLSLLKYLLDERGIFQTLVYLYLLSIIDLRQYFHDVDLLKNIYYF